MTVDATRSYWDTFYASRASDVPGEPSAFASWVADRIPAGAPVAEFGFGTARDSLFFARTGHQVHGFDFADSAVAAAQVQADAFDLPARFQTLDLEDTAAVVGAAEQLTSLDSPVVYGRFLIHSLHDDARGNLLDLAAKALAGGGELLLEFRTGQDAEGTHLFGDDHYRVYLDPQIVVDEIVARGGTVTHNEAGHGFAIYKTEDPHVARLAATFS